MSDRSTNKPPVWCKHAVPTVQGWAHPDTGEILKVKRGLLDNVIKVEEIVVEQDIEAVALDEEPILEQPVKEVKKPAKRTYKKRNALKEITE